LKEKGPQKGGNRGVGGKKEKFSQKGHLSTGQEPFTLKRKMEPSLKRGKIQGEIFGVLPFHKKAPPQPGGVFKRTKGPFPRGFPRGKRDLKLNLTRGKKSLSPINFFP